MLFRCLNMHEGDNNTFSYYGSKSKIVHLYPRPKFDTIIEPFAGSGRYALRYFDRNVILVDKDETIIKVWKYLQQASEKDILDLPIPNRGEPIQYKDFDCIEAAWLMGFLIVSGCNAPRLSMSPMRDSGYIQDQKRDISRQLFKIRHWKLIHGEYDCLANIEATWFIDPPYFQGGEYYRESARALNFENLGQYVQARNGQVIACESSAASWMPFMKLKNVHGSIKASTEVWWTNEFEPIQNQLF